MMEWLNQPKSWQHEGQTIRVRSEGQTDFWRLTHDGGIRDNGHFYYQQVRGNFVAEVALRGEFRDLYDQAGLMIRLSHEYWIKCGIEYVDQTPYASVVVTKNHSDWSVLPLANQESPVTFRIQRTNALLEFFLVRKETEYQLIRQTTFTDEPTLAVGLMIASPKGDGFTAEFSDWKIQPST